MSNYWGYHLLIDIGGCEEGIFTKENIKAFTDELIEAIDMTAWGPTHIEYFGEDKPEVAGFSMMQLILTSSITGHFVDLSREAYIDVFSCKPFTQEDAEKVVRKYFKPERVTAQYIYRKA